MNSLYQYRRNEDGASAGYLAFAKGFDFNLTKFAFIVHPIAAKDAARKYPILKFLPDAAVEAIMGTMKPKFVSHITGVRSITGAETEGWFIGLPMTPHMLTDPNRLDFAYDQIVKCTEMAHKLGADLIGLGAFSSVVGDGGLTIAKRSPIAVTTGNSYTVATAIEGAMKAAAMLDLPLETATLAVIGATGSIGKTCARILAPKVMNTWVIGRDLERAEALAETLPRAKASIEPRDLRNADIVITVSSAGKEIVFPEHLKPGAIVVDVARPRDVSIRVAQERPDVLVIEGGVVSIPGDVQFNFNFGFPPKTAYACMSETMMLALDGRAESLTLGKDVSVEQVEDTWRMAEKHGFGLAGFRSFEREVGPEAIDRARRARGRTAVAV